MTYNLYRVYAPGIDLPRQTTASIDSFAARTRYAAGHIGMAVTDVVAIRVREGNLVQVRDKRDGAIAITKAQFVGVEEDSGHFAQIEIVEDDMLSPGFKIGVPVSCIELLGEKN